MQRSSTDRQDGAATALKVIDYAVALADPETWEIRFENARFFDWFAPAADLDAPLHERIPGLDLDRARSRLTAGRSYSCETEVKSGARSVSVEVKIRRREPGAQGAPVLVVEGANISKRKEAEYMLDSYSQMSERNARELRREKERVEKLLLNIMPRVVYEELRDYGTTTPQLFESASVLMLDFVDFTDMALARDPSALISELNDIFSAFDRITELFACERIKTIGDAYVAVSGVPEAVPDHAANVARVALRMRRYLERRNATNPIEWRCRIGIATGPLIGSLVGIQKYVYDIFGPAANLAARMEATSEPMQITLSEETYNLLKTEFSATERGVSDIKGFGEQRLFTLDRESEGQRLGAV